MGLSEQCAMDVTLLEIYNRLFAHFGPLHGPDAPGPWWPIFSDEPLLEMLIGAILVQQTRWEAVEAAIMRLHSAGLLSLPALAAADSAALAALIRPCAFHTQKAPGLIAIARYINEQYQGELAMMLARPTAQLRRELLNLPRIGPETADVILLYAGNHPVFVIDEYTRRLFERVSPLIDHRTARQDRPPAGGRLWRAPYEEVRASIEKQFAPLSTPADATIHDPAPAARLFAEYHAQINEQCVRYCLSTPRCDGPPARRIYSRQQGREHYLAHHEGCPLRAICNWYRAKESML